MKTGKALALNGLAAKVAGCAAVAGCVALAGCAASSGSRATGGSRPAGSGSGYYASEEAPASSRKSAPTFGYSYRPRTDYAPQTTTPPPAPGASPSREIRGRTYGPGRAPVLKWKSSRYPVGGNSETVRPRPEERPGLATVAGEARWSPVRRVTFVRANPSRPWGMVSIYYNNRAGISAQVQHRIAWLRCRECALGFRMVCSRGGYWRRAYCPIIQWQPVRKGVDVWVEDAYGNMLPGLRVAGRSYVIGHQGHRYVLVVRNSTWQRFEVVASVDGLDVLDRAPAGLGKRGYILGPNSTLRIQGFRLDAARVAAFRFGSVGQSLAANTYGDRHVGVVGVAVFNERRVYYNPYHKDIQLRATARPFPLSSYPPVP